MKQANKALVEAAYLQPKCFNQSDNLKQQKCKTKVQVASENIYGLEI